MDFHSLTRRELQSLCKLNKIPANITNIAMADALQSLEIVEGIEEFLNVSQSETDGMVESTEKVDVSSPKVPHTRCRTSTRQKVKSGEAENLPPTATRTTRRGSKQLAGGVEESKSNMLETPALSSTKRKALATSSCRNVNSQLDQELECIPNSPAVVVTNSRRRGATASTHVATASTHGATVRKESTIQKTYSTRRSTRLTEKKSAEPRVRKESEEAVKMNSFLDEINVTSTAESLDEVNVTSKEVDKPVEVPENTVGSGKPNAEVEDICNAFEKLDVLIEESAHSLVLEKDVNIEATSEEEKVDCGELDNLKLETDETSNPCEDGDLEEKLKVDVLIEESAHSLVLEKDVNIEATSEEEKVHCGELDNLKMETDETSNPCEDGDLEEKLKVGEMFDLGEKVSSEAKNDEVYDQKTQLDGISSSCEKQDLEEKLDSGEKFDASEVSSKASGDNLSAIKDHKLVMVPEEDLDRLLHNNASLESGVAGAEDIDVDAIPFNTENLSGPAELGRDDMFFAVSEMKDQVQDNNGCSSMVSNTVLCNTENPSETLKLDDENNTADEITTKDMEEVTNNMVDETMDNISTMPGEVEDLKPELAESNVNEKAPGCSSMVSNKVLCNTENPSEALKLDNENNIADEITTTDMEEVTNKMVDETIDNISTMTGEVEDLKLELFAEGNVNEKAPGCSSMVSNTVLCNTENPSEALKLDDENKYADEITTKDMEEVTNNKVDETIENISTMTGEVEDLKPELFTECNVNVKAPASQNLDCAPDGSIKVDDVSSIKEENQLCVFPIKKSLSKTATSYNNMSIVSDDKENIERLQTEGKKSKKEKDDRSLTEISIRQLRKQVKALTLKNKNANEDANKEATTRPALQALCENQMVGGDTNN